jgi:tRNA A-37 threonylcarbamoyl transferase component Bud32
MLYEIIRKDKFDESTDMLVMERLYPVDFQRMNKQERILAFERFETQLNELHINGFLHGDIEHPIRGTPKFLFNNIILTNSGLRLVDTGFSLIRKDEPDKARFIRLLRGEMLEIMDFKEYFLGS